MERLLHYTWQQRLYPSPTLTTTSGQLLEVLDPGLHNFDAGPDFFNAKIRMGHETLVGNVEIHSYSSDWNRHQHQLNPSYNNVILHVVEHADTDEIYTQDGRRLMQVELEIPPYVEQNYLRLQRQDFYPPCQDSVGKMPSLLVHQWLDALRMERLEQKTERINGYADEDCGNWERAFFITLARSFGFGINGDAFESWARIVPLGACGKHRDMPFQIEAIFLGQAGLLTEDMIPAFHRSYAQEDGYFTKLQNEYRFLAHKFTLTPMNGYQWKFLRLRPQNFPHIRLVQLANLYCSQRLNLSALLDAKTLDEVKDLFRTGVTPYWETHYGFGAESARSAKQLSNASLNSLAINAAVPMLFAYGKHRFNEEYCTRAMELLEQLPAEGNRYTRIWKEMGLTVNTAADSQAIIQLHTHYCYRKDCLRCRWGYQFLKQR
ncbi:MAG: DUF2851 family protein [Bacteroidaceae bacterium]|nr:DUF2851 family protein [Bacteroidaceae bacterium]